VARRRGIEDDDVPFIGVDVLDQQVERCDLVAAGRRAARKEFLDLRVRETDPSAAQVRRQRSRQFLVALSLRFGIDLDGPEAPRSVVVGLARRGRLGSLE